MRSNSGDNHSDGRARDTLFRLVEYAQKQQTSHKARLDSHCRTFGTLLLALVVGQYSLLFQSGALDADRMYTWLFSFPVGVFAVFVAVAGKRAAFEEILGAEFYRYVIERIEEFTWYPWQISPPRVLYREWKVLALGSATVSAGVLRVRSPANISDDELRDMERTLSRSADDLRDAWELKRLTRRLPVDYQPVGLLTFGLVVAAAGLVLALCRVLLALQAKYNFLG